MSSHEPIRFEKPAQPRASKAQIVVIAAAFGVVAWFVGVKDLVHHFMPDDNIAPQIFTPLSPVDLTP